MTERIVVIGHSAVTCLGRDMDQTWRGLIAGQSGLRRDPRLRSEEYLQDIAGRVVGFEPGTSPEDRSAARLEARNIHFALVAARAAWKNAGLPNPVDDPDRVAVLVGSGLGGMDFYHIEQRKSHHRKTLGTSPYLIPGLIANQASGQVAQALGLYGPSVAPANACATGGHALALGAMMLRSGDADLALCGASESAFAPLVVNGFATMKAMMGRRSADRSNDDPSLASRPFSVDRAGFLMAEGSGMLVLATESMANRLGVQPQAELLSWALNSDGHHMALPHGGRIARCLASTIARAGLHPEQVDYYNAHGTSTVVNDRIETEAIKTVFGKHAYQMPISSIKGAIGHSMGAASAIEAAVCVRALREQVVPPTINYLPDPELDLDYVPNQSRPLTLNTIMSASFGFGGTNNALLFRRWADV